MGARLFSRQQPQLLHNCLTIRYRKLEPLVWIGHWVAYTDRALVWCSQCPSCSLDKGVTGPHRYIFGRISPSLKGGAKPDPPVARTLHDADMLGMGPVRADRDQP